ncbi:MAG: PQQ-dependent sugar dehydrogenase [Candidatus Sungbacteria bacterium]|nr:PQQ-dependent sugar dehydrogenase [Candidatus Sungbacteria bacterium]
MHRGLQISLGVVVLLAIIGGAWYWSGRDWNQSAPDANNAAMPVPNATTTEFGLTLPGDFSISILTSDVPGARALVRDSFGNLWVSQTSEGMISTVELSQDEAVKRVQPVFRNMQKPHGIALDPIHPLAFYIAEEDKISRVGLYSDGPVEKIADLPAGGRHTTRSLSFSPDGKLFVSVGSSCDVCHESDNRRAKILELDIESGELSEFARGLRNAVFMAFHPKTGALWATEMGRDNLGDNLPPDEVNIIEKGKNYGWPICYGKNIHDSAFDKNTYIRNPCMEPLEVQSAIDLQAHSAPLGLAFIPEEGWPAEYHHDLLVAYHGSWNRSEPTGYKIVRFRLDAEGRPEGGGAYEAEDFITGWLDERDEVNGRPVDILVESNGLIYITDDKGGRIYKVQHRSE